MPGLYQEISRRQYVSMCECVCVCMPVGVYTCKCKKCKVSGKWKNYLETKAHSPQSIYARYMNEPERGGRAEIWGMRLTLSNPSLKKARRTFILET